MATNRVAGAQANSDAEIMMGYHSTLPLFLFQESYGERPSAFVLLLNGQGDEASVMQPPASQR